MNSDRLTKQIVIVTLCLMAGGMVAVVCNLAIRQLPIPVEIKDLTTYIVGVLSGMLIKTGVDSVTGHVESPAPDEAEGFQPAPASPRGPRKPLDLEDYNIGAKTEPTDKTAG